MPPSSRPAKRGRVYVENIESIITCEGDLIVAGTRGQLLAWVPGPMNEGFIEAGDDRALVNVAWADYLFVDAEQDEDPPKPCTLSQENFFITHTEVRNLRRVG